MSVTYLVQVFLKLALLFSIAFKILFSYLFNLQIILTSYFLYQSSMFLFGLLKLPFFFEKHVLILSQLFLSNLTFFFLNLYAIPQLFIILFQFLQFFHLLVFLPDIFLQFCYLSISLSDLSRKSLVFFFFLIIFLCLGLQFLLQLILHFIHSYLKAWVFFN